jgi:hypothetical protein
MGLRLGSLWAAGRAQRPCCTARGWHLELGCRAKPSCSQLSACGPGSGSGSGPEIPDPDCRIRTRLTGSGPGSRTEPGTPPSGVAHLATDAPRGDRLRPRLPLAPARHLGHPGPGIGKNEAWVADRTGHRSSQMMARYPRRARLATELGLGGFKPLNEVVQEIAEHASDTARDRIARAEGLVVAPGVRDVRFGGTSPEEEKASEDAGFQGVGHEGLEPSASGLRVRCSTN